VVPFTAVRLSKRMVLAMTSLLAFGAIVPKAAADATEPQDDARTRAIVSAATAFLATLDED
jgi:hypothetical protein